MSDRLPSLAPKEVISALERANFYIHRTTGSHHAMRHRERLELRITIAFHRKDLSRKTLRSIIRQTGMTTEEFIDLL